MEEDEFKDTEIGRIPKDWEIISASKIATYYNGYPFKPSQWKNHGLPIIRIQNLTNSSDIIHYFEGTLNKRYQIDKGDLLLSWSATLNVYIWKGPTAYLNQHIFKVVPNKIVDKYYLYFSLLMVINKFKGQTHGSTMKHFVKSALSDVVIPIPPLEEQKRIAYVLSKIENAIKIQDRIINSLQELKKSMMHKLFTEGIGHTEFKDTEIGRIPKEWEIKKISELFSIEHGISITPKRRKLRANYPMLRTSNMGWGKISLEKIDYSWFSDDEIKNLNLQYGDLLVCEGGDIGRTAMWTGELEKVGYQNHLHRLRKKYDSVSPLFYMYWMQYAILYSHLYINEGNKTTIPNLSKSKIMNFNVVYTTYEEQKRIADILSAIDNKISIEEKRKDSFENLFKSMLNELMTGQIRVKNLEMRE